MNYILKYYIRSKYIGFTKSYYHEFDTILDLTNFVEKHNKEIKDFEVFISFERLIEYMESE